MTRERTWAPAHPDADLLASLDAAVRSWRDVAHTEPTSSLTGGGAVRAFEEALSGLHDHRPALLLPSATYGLRLALETVGVGPGDEVVIPALDWPASLQAVRSLGAVPVIAAVDPSTFTLSPAAVRGAVTARTRALVACHLHGVAADVPAIRDSAPGLPVIEDGAAALGSSLDGRAVGTLGDLAVLSFGPGKQLSLGEGGALIASTDELHRRALRLSAHPTRLRLEGIDHPGGHEGLPMRGNPLTALLGWHLLREWDPSGRRSRHAAAAASLRGDDRVLRVLTDDRRTSTGRLVPVVARPGCGARLGSATSAFALGPVPRETADVRLVPVIDEASRDR